MFMKYTQLFIYILKGYIYTQQMFIKYTKLFLYILKGYIYTQENVYQVHKIIYPCTQRLYLYSKICLSSTQNYLFIYSKVIFIP